MTAKRDKHPPEDWADKATKTEEAEAERGEIKDGFKVNDRRHWAEGVDDAEAEEAQKRLEKPEYVRALEEEIKQKDETLRRYIEQYKAAKQQMNESITRVEREKAREVNFRIAELARTFLTILDDLTAASKAANQSDDVEAIRKGLDLIAQRIQRSLSEIGVEPIEAQGQRHDPKLHDAVAVQDVEEADKDGVILEELKKGYMLGETLVRPSSVVVGRTKD